MNGAHGSVNPPGIWRHAGLFHDGGGPARLAVERGWTLGEGDTATESWEDLAEELGLRRLCLKREDQNPGRSHKDRGLLHQIAAHRVDPQGHEQPAGAFVLSSSGNAAVSAAAVCALTGDRLLAFVAPDTDRSKLAALYASGAEVFVCDKPMNYARYAARVFGLLDLRGTRDPAAPTGYRSLAAEILEAAPRVGAIVTFSSSGISMRGLLDGLAAVGRRVPCFAVQAGVSLGLARAAGLEVLDEPDNPAGRGGIRTPPDADELVADLHRSGGGVIVVRREALLGLAARMEARSPECGGPLRTSAEGAAVLAGIAAHADRLRGREVVAVITGHAAQWPERHGHESALGPRDPARSVVSDLLDSYQAVRARICALGLEPA